jgi:hypothetical protein
VVAPGSNGNILTSNGSTWTSAAPAGGGVTSAVAGNGIAVSGATGAVTFSVACPSFNSVGSYCTVGSGQDGNLRNYTSGTTYSAGGSAGTLSSTTEGNNNEGGTQIPRTNNLSGTWRLMSGPTGNTFELVYALACRVS